MKEDKKICFKNIINDIDHYKKSKQFIKLLENLNKIINKKKNLFETIINELELNSKLIDQDEKNTIIKKIDYFIDKNKKKYLNKKIIDKSIIYEYEDHYLWYPNDKKINLEKEYKNIFYNKTIMDIKVDQQKRTKLDKITTEDIKYSNIIRIKIKK